MILPKVRDNQFVVCSAAGAGCRKMSCSEAEKINFRHVTNSLFMTVYQEHKLDMCKNVSLGIVVQVPCHHFTSVVEPTHWFWFSSLFLKKKAWRHSFYICLNILWTAANMFSSPLPRRDDVDTSRWKCSSLKLRPGVTWDRSKRQGSR